MKFRKIKNKLINFSFGKISIVLLLVYTFMCGSDLNYAQKINMNIFEYMLYTLTDHYYMIYAWLFFLVFFSVCQAREKCLMERLRYNTLRDFYLLEQLVKAVQIFALILMHGGISFILGISRLKFCNIFSVMPSAGVFDSNLDVIMAYAREFETPVSAIICVLAYWGIGSVFISDVIYYSSEIGRKKGMFISIFIVLISTMTGFMTDIDEHFFEFLFLNNYYILHHVLLNIGKISVVVNLLVMPGIIVVLQRLAMAKNCNRKIKKKRMEKILFEVRPRIYISFFTAFFLLGIQIGEKDACSLVWGLVRGFSYQEFQLIEFLYYIAPFLFVLFWVNAAWEKEAECDNELAMFRFGSRKKWEKIMERSCVKFLAKNCLVYLGGIGVVFLGGTIAYGIKSREWLNEMTEYYGTEGKTVLYAVLLSFVMRVLEFYLLYYIDRVVYVLTKHSILSYIVPFAIYIPEMIFPDRHLFWGKGSAYQIMELFADKKEYVIPIIIGVNIGFIGLLWVINRKRRILCQK